MNGISNNGRLPEPDWLRARPDSIPEELKTLRQFLVWKAEFRKSKWTKPPYNARNGSAGSTTNPDTWSTFEETKWAYENGSWTGIGIAMSPPFAGVDLDHCVDPAELQQMVGRLTMELEIAKKASQVVIYQTRKNGR